MAKVNQKTAAYLVRQKKPFEASALTGGWFGAFTPTKGPTLGRLPQEHRPPLAKALRKGSVYIVLSYETPIAWSVNGQWVVPGVKYSPTTTKHQHIVRRAIQPMVKESTVGAIVEDTMRGEPR